MKYDIDYLFKKYIDNTCSDEELEMFYSCLNEEQHDPKIRQLMTELFHYVDLTFDPESDELTKDNEQSQRKNRQFDELRKTNAKRKDEIYKLIEKINKEYKIREPGNKKQGLWGWVKRFFP